MTVRLGTPPAQHRSIIAATKREERRDEFDPSRVLAMLIGDSREAAEGCGAFVVLERGVVAKRKFELRRNKTWQVRFHQLSGGEYDS
jgi:hypothetical protein